MGRVFRKAFRILGLGERKGRWAMEQDFHGDFQVNVTWFFASFSGVLDWVVLILVWFERSLHSTQVSRQSCPWPLKLLMPQAVERTWICTGGSGPNGLIWCDYFMIYTAITRTEATQTTAFFTAGFDSSHPRHCQNIFQLALPTLLEKWFWLKDYAQFHCLDLDLWLANFKICLKTL